MLARTLEVLRIRGLRRPRQGLGRSPDPLQMPELSLETVIRNYKKHNIFGFSRLCLPFGQRPRRGR